VRGFLHRLGARTLGQAPVVRPATRLRWYGDETTFESTETVTIGPPQARTERSAIPLDEKEPISRVDHPRAEKVASVRATPNEQFEPRVREEDSDVTRRSQEPPEVVEQTSSSTRHVDPQEVPQQRPQEALPQPARLPHRLANSPRPMERRAHAESPEVFREMSRPAPQAEVVPDVHIHIGRIELTAVPVVEAPRPPPRNPKKPLSLEEYLQPGGRRGR
jgi:hypothetical protein